MATNEARESLQVPGMKLEDLRRFAFAQGMKIIEGESALWVEKRQFFLESLPQHRRIRVSRAETARLFLRGAAVIRYTCDEAEGSSSFEYVWDDKNYGLDSLHKDAKRNVRKNLEKCSVRRVPYDLLRREGLAINQSVFARQGRQMPKSFLTDEGLWRKYLDVCETLPFIEAYGAFIDGRLCAFSLVLLMDGYCYTYHPFASADSLKHYAMNVLIYSIVRTMLDRAEIHCVSYGLESFAPHPTLERFKLAMGCRKRPIGRRVVINPLARPIFSSPGAWMTGKLLRAFKPGLTDEFEKLSRALQHPAPAQT